MAVKIMLCREGNRLAPADPWSAEAVDGMTHGEIVTASITRTRNVRFHRKFFAFLNLIFENQERYKTLDHMLTAMKQAVGWGDYADSTDGKSKIFIPRSISFSKLDESGFRKFYDSFVAVVVTDILPGIDADSLEKEVEAFLV